MILRKIIELFNKKNDYGNLFKKRLFILGVCKGVGMKETRVVDREFGNTHTNTPTVFELIEKISDRD